MAHHFIRPLFSLSFSPVCICRYMLRFHSNISPTSSSKWTVFCTQHRSLPPEIFHYINFLQLWISFIVFSYLFIIHLPPPHVKHPENGIVTRVFFWFLSWICHHSVEATVSKVYKLSLKALRSCHNDVWERNSLHVMCNNKLS